MTEREIDVEILAQIVEEKVCGSDHCMMLREKAAATIRTLQSERDELERRLEDEYEMARGSADANARLARAVERKDAALRGLREQHRAEGCVGDKRCLDCIAADRALAPEPDTGDYSSGLNLTSAGEVELRPLNGMTRAAAREWLERLKADEEPDTEVEDGE